MVALDFLLWLDDRGLTLERLTQADVDRWLVGGTTSRYDLRAFLAWTTSQKLTSGLVVPSRTIEAPSLMLGEETRWRQLRRCLTDTSLPLDIRAAGAIILLFGTAISRVVGLTAEDLCRREDKTYLVLDRHPVLLPSPRRPSHAARCHGALPLGAWPKPAPHSMAIPWRQPRPPRRAWQARPQAHAARHPCPRRPQRPYLPSPPIYQHRSLRTCSASTSPTAVRWARYVQRDWTAYLAARADHPPPLSGGAEETLEQP